MSTFFDIYLGLWLILTLAALLLLIWPTRRFELLSSDYLRFLTVPWKRTTFFVSLGGFILLAPLSGAPTWDWFNATFMSVLAYLTAPWSLATLARWWRGDKSFVHAYVAAVIWLLSASWSYDFYLLMRDGTYPSTWLPNLVASSLLYAGAGLLWNLDWSEEHGVHLAFVREDWPAVRSGSFWKVAPYVVALAAGAGIVVLVFPIAWFWG